MSVTVRFDPRAGSQQAQIISDASPFNDGVMSKAQAQALNILNSTLAVQSNTVTTDAVPVVSTTFPMTRDGVASTIVNLTASNSDGTDWALWLLAVAIVARTTGTVMLIAPVGPQAPAAQAGATSATWTIELVAGVDNFQLKVKGAVGVTVKWNSVLFVNYSAQ